ANDNLIAECLSQEVFCVATNSELNVAQFTEMLAANTTAETRCLALEAELANLRVDRCPIASRSQPMSHVKPNRISPAKGDTKLPIDDQPRKNKFHLRTSTRIDSSSRLKRTVINSHSDSVCQTCAKCLTPFNHDLCVDTCLQSSMATPSIHYNRSVERKVKQVWKPKQVRQV
nr:hypothetical protein [Tanacetum cinerariifolium]